ncbi:hypothetical protein BJV78DRAFT_1281404 [Lactifluus subvellereus]|nr:hypothetical protein BJV78DRAFT_1281404 [Lactifluus subvellereus]
MRSEASSIYTRKRAQLNDTIRVRNLLLLASVADGAQWPSSTSAPVRQPVRVCVSVPYDLRPAAAGDDISKSINYGSLSKQILASVEDPSCQFGGLERLTDHIFGTCFDAFSEIQRMEVDVVKPRALPYAESIRILSSRARDGSCLVPDRFSIQRLSCNLVVGLNPCEREDKQLVSFDVEISRQTLAPDSDSSRLDFRRLARDIRQEVESSEFISLESLASLAAQITLRHADQPDAVVTVRAAKPKALVFADAAEVEIVRTSRDYPSATGVEVSTLGAPLLTLDPPFAPSLLGLLAQVAGTNLGDRFANIEAALRLLEQPELVSASEEAGTASSLAVFFELRLYHKNYCCSSHSPGDSKNIECTVGRVPSIRNGPRAVDLDILFYDDEVIDTRPESLRENLEGLEGHLVVPHPKMAEREFVLRPLSELCSSRVPQADPRDALRRVKVIVFRQFSAMIKVMPFPTYPHSAGHTAPSPPVANVPEIPHTHTYWTFPPSRSAMPAGQVLSTPRRTRLMATLNVTPDSFSDGSDHVELSAALNYVRSSAAAAADIVDIGGYSTRPGAAYVSPEEEISRVVPVIERIRTPGPDDDNDKNDKYMLIALTHSALTSGLLRARCAGDGDALLGRHEEDRPGACRPRHLMHSRGDAGANKDYSRYRSVVDGVAQELGEKVEAIVRGPGGVRRWLVMVDPGIGFSKSVDDNVQLLRASASVTADVRTVDGAWNPLRGHPQLIGASRKSFLGVILSQTDDGGTYKGRQTKPKERGWATAAASRVQYNKALLRSVCMTFSNLVTW